MEKWSRLSLVAEMIRDHISLDGIDRYLAETGVQGCDFVLVQPSDFAGEIFAVDGSNVSICNWSTANVNLIRAGYAVYRGRDWKRTVITFDDVFVADAKLCRNMFDPYLEQFFGLNGVDLKESDLDRLSSYYRELQEYVAINEALGEAHAGDIVLYDGSFDVFELLRDALAVIFARAEEKGVALLAVAKSSSLFWGEEITLPFVQHTSMAGSRLTARMRYIWIMN
ncbi:MAG: DNA double-strand break repair nuclease NurA [Methanothrix sp.]|nr:DNA double-strand break repair nuclease NurA [Methanothrix sp.]